MIDMEKCTHKFVFKGNNSFKRSASRNSMEFVSVDSYFCEHCLEEQEVRKATVLSDSEVLYKLPDWAKTITQRVQGFE